MRIRFYRRRNDPSAECYRAVRWPMQESRHDKLLAALQAHVGKYRPGRAMIVRDRWQPLALTFFQDVTKAQRQAGAQAGGQLYRGDWIVMPMDRLKPISVLGNNDFQAAYEDVTLKSEAYGP